MKEKIRKIVSERLPAPLVIIPMALYFILMLPFRSMKWWKDQNLYY